MNRVATREVAKLPFDDAIPDIALPGRFRP